MNQEFTEQFGKALSIIPLIDIPTIKRDNAARMDWQEVCANVPHRLNADEQLQAALEIDEMEPIEQQEIIARYTYDEIYLIGNPPYKGARKQSAAQKNDFKAYFVNEEYSGNLDYISLWFIKGSRYISGTNAKLAFVSVNSVCQGEHVGIMFPKIFDENVEIGFAYTSFKWKNSARDNAGVTVIVLSLQNKITSKKFIFTDSICNVVEHINPYITKGDDLIVHKRSRALSELPEMSFGSMPNDGGHLVITTEESERYPELMPFTKRFYGAEEFINSRERYCLWITDANYKQAVQVPEIARRIEAVRDTRLKSRRAATNKLASSPYKFGEVRYKSTKAILVPEVSSENRVYIPIGYVEENVVISNKAFAIYDAELWIFALLESKMHMAWIHATCGQLETRISYSSTLGYNTFPFNSLSETDKTALGKSARNILLSRAAHPEKTLANMYDPDKMPADLREAHEENDHIVDNLYKKGGFTNDEDRLAALFGLYEQMTAKEKAK